MPRRKQARAFSKVGPPTQAQQESRLLNLPAELRNQIYEYTFSSSPVEISRRSFLKLNPKGLLKSSGLLLACKQIHHEAVQLYYSLTTFYVQRGAEYRIAHWINRIGPLRKALIQNIQLKDGVAISHIVNDTSNTHWSSTLGYEIYRSTKDGKLEAGVVKCRCESNGAYVWVHEPFMLWTEIQRAAARRDGGWAWVLEPKKEFEHLLPFAKSVDEPAR